MSSYRPICDTWILARAKLKGGHKYYGAYPGGFLERARALLGISLHEPLLHVCGGKAKHYPYKRGFGKNDCTLDLDKSLRPTFLQDARDPFPQCHFFYQNLAGYWPAILMDPPYSEFDADKYKVGKEKYPKPGLLLKNAFEVLRPGGRVGILHYMLPRPLYDAIFTHLITIYVGFNNRARTLSVFEKPYV